MLFYGYYICIQYICNLNITICILPFTYIITLPFFLQGYIVVQDKYSVE